MKPRKTIYYTDELHDDFSPTNGQIHTVSITGDYPYLPPKNPFWHALAFLCYRMLATPVAWVWMYVFRGMRVKNRKAVRKIRSGYFLWGNHTQVCGDAFTPSLLTFPRKANVIVHPDIVSIPVVRHLVKMMGAVPVPGDLPCARKLFCATQHFIERGQVITTYPEAHIWPYFNGVRHFSDSSFSTPLILGVPSVAFVVTYRKRRLFRFLPPPVTVTLSDPIYPQECKNKTELRNRVYHFMRDTIDKEGSYAYVQYIKKEEDHDDNHCV